MATKNPDAGQRPLKIGDRVTGRTNRGSEITGRVAEFRTGTNGQHYVGVQATKGAPLRFTRLSQLVRV